MPSETPEPAGSCARTACPRGQGSRVLRADLVPPLRERPPPRSECGARPLYPAPHRQVLRATRVGRRKETTQVFWARDSATSPPAAPQPDCRRWAVPGSASRAQAVAPVLDRSAGPAQRKADGRRRRSQLAPSANRIHQMQACSALTHDDCLRGLQVSHSPSNNSFRKTRPCGHAPCPLAVLIWPARPISISRPPQASAQRRAKPGPA